MGNYWWVRGRGMFQCDKGHKPLAAMAAWASTPQQATMVAKSGIVDVIYK